MAKLLDWIKKASTRILDPRREERITALAQSMETLLIAQRDAFDFEKSSVALGVTPQDIQLVSERLYEFALQRTWRDLKITSKERAALDWVAQAVHLDKPSQRKVEDVAGRAVFAEYLAQAMADGILDSEEIDKLRRIATDIGTSVRTLVSTYFRKEGEGFLRGVFASVVETGTIKEVQWNSLIDATIALGFTDTEFQKIIRPQVEPFLEHVLADAKSDDYLSAKERDTLGWLLDKLPLRPSFRSYVEEEVAQLRLLTDVKDGRLPSVQAHRVLLRAGEIAHLQARTLYEQIRHLQSGPRSDMHLGLATITDVRFIFSGETKAFEINHRKVLGIIPLVHGFQLRTNGKGSGNYDFTSNNKLALAVYEAAVGKWNQTLVKSTDRTLSRHIPREIRQRVWQEYSGRCVECGATQYLEFDHIIPVAKGGSNSETNVQLLCRKCNLKKSDKI